MKRLAMVLLLFSMVTFDAAPSEPAVLLELFTSQGCSSCPRADDVLSRLAADPAYRGKVIPLAFHVDYWNHLGWSDPFSSAQWSERQHRYAEAFHAEQVYTPQLVIDGSSELAGSREELVRQGVAAALRSPQPGTVAVISRRSGGGADITVKASLAKGSAGPLAVMVAVVENGRVTLVRRGENHDRTLRNDRVVRLLRNAGTVRPGEAVTLSTTVAFAREWNPHHLEAVVFLQDPATMRIYGAGSAPL